MTLNIEKTNESATIKINGRLDTISAPMLENAVNELPASINDLVLDVRDMEYISSAGLRVLLMAQKKMSKAGTMKLVGVCDAVMEVFEMTGFADILTVE